MKVTSFSSQKKSLVSIIIRAKNEGKSLLTLLPLLYAQRTESPFEVVLLNNASTDQTAQVIRDFPQLKVQTIPEGQFHFSKSLNDAARLVTSPILVHLSAHCFPTAHLWLQRLVESLLTNPGLLATYGRQFSAPHVNIYEHKDYQELLFPAKGEPVVKSLSNANAAFRRQAVLNHPFDETIPILEDHLWYLEQGERSRVLYVPGATVLHLHPLFNLNYYRPRWTKEGWAIFYIRHVKKLDSAMTSPKFANRFFGWRRWASFTATAFALLRENLLMYSLAAIPFYLLRDHYWRKGFQLALKQFEKPNSRATQI